MSSMSNNSMGWVSFMVSIMNHKVLKKKSNSKKYIIVICLPSQCTKKIYKYDLWSYWNHLSQQIN